MAPSDSDVGSSLELISPGMNLQENNAIRTLLRDRDEELAKLKQENSQLVLKLSEETKERLKIQERFEKLDSMISDWLAGMEMDKAHDQISSSLDELRQKLTNRRSGLANLQVEKRQLDEAVESLQKELDFVKSENFALNAENTRMNDQSKLLTREKEEQRQTLEKALKVEKERRMRSEKQLRTVECLNIESNRMTEKGHHQMRAQLNEAVKNLELATEARDAARQELLDIRDKTRKLLFKLNLSNDIEDVSLALEHARDIVYNRRGKKINTQTPRDSPNPTPFLQSPVPHQSNGMQSSFSPSPRTSDFASFTLTNSASPGSSRPLCCKICGKNYSESSNFEGACVYHLPGAKKIHVGTKLEVWSCCRSRDTMKGCQLGRHKMATSSNLQISNNGKEG